MKTEGVTNSASNYIYKSYTSAYKLFYARYIKCEIRIYTSISNIYGLKLSNDRNNSSGSIYYLSQFM